MIKVMAFLSRRAGLDRAAFVEHYENHHVPLVLSLAPAPLVYLRNYPQEPAEFDVVTELVFADRPAYEAWVGTMYGPASGGRVAADEETFLDRARTRSYVVEEYGAQEYGAQEYGAQG